MKPLEITAFAGVRNDVSEERFNKNDLSKATNIELDNTGKPYRRLGTTVLDPTATHSVWAEDEFCYCVRGGALTRVLSDMSFQSLGVTITGSRVCYLKVNNDVFWSDGVQTGVLSAAGNRMWGIPVPTFSATTGAGVLVEGRYLVTVTHVRSDGLESGAAPVQAIVVGAGNGITVTLPNSSDASVVEKRVYVSDVNGEVPYLCMTLTASDTTATLSQLPAARTLAVRTLRMGPPPASTAMALYKGRIYVADYNYLWYTEPYEYELVKRAMNYAGFASPIKTIASVSDGLFVGSEDTTHFLRGNEPAQFEATVVADYGTVAGTELYVRAEHMPASNNEKQNAAVWMSKKGLCAGFDNGEMKNLTGERFVLPEGVATGASLLKLRGASPQLVTTLFS